MTSRLPQGGGSNLPPPLICGMSLLSWFYNQWKLCTKISF